MTTIGPGMLLLFHGHNHLTSSAFLFLSFPPFLVFGVFLGIYPRQDGDSVVVFSTLYLFVERRMGVCVLYQEIVSS